MADIVRDYLRGKDYADHVVRGGLEGLVGGYEKLVESVSSGAAQDRDEYLNDMDGRHVLEEAMAIAPSEQRACWIERLREADQKIRPHLRPSEHCLWGEENAKRYGYSRTRDWWYYHEPEGGFY